LSGRHVLPVCTTVTIGDATILTAGATVFNELSAPIEGAEVALTLGGAIFLACPGLTALARRRIGGRDDAEPARSGDAEPAGRPRRRSGRGRGHVPEPAGPCG